MCVLLRGKDKKKTKHKYTPLKRKTLLGLHLFKKNVQFLFRSETNWKENVKIKAHGRDSVWKRLQLDYYTFFLFSFLMAGSSVTTTCDGAPLCRTKTLSLMLEVDTLRARHPTGAESYLIYFTSELVFLSFLPWKDRRVHVADKRACVRACAHTLTRAILVSPWVPLTLGVLGQR